MEPTKKYYLIYFGRSIASYSALIMVISQAGVQLEYNIGLSKGDKLKEVI